MISGWNILPTVKFFYKSVTRFNSWLDETIHILFGAPRLINFETKWEKICVIFFCFWDSCLILYSNFRYYRNFALLNFLAICQIPGSINMFCNRFLFVQDCKVALSMTPIHCTSRKFGKLNVQTLLLRFEGVHVFFISMVFFNLRLEYA